MRKIRIANLMNMSCYLGPIWIFSYVTYKLKNDSLDLFHIRQGLGLFLTWFMVVVMMYVPLLGILMIIVFLILMPSLAIIGMINAFKGSCHELPLIGKLIASTLKNFK